MCERHLPSGMVRLELTLSPDEAALILQAVEKARDELRHAPRQARPDAPRQVRAQAAGLSAEAPAAIPAATAVPVPAVPAATAATAATAALTTPPTRADGALHLARSFLASDDAAGSHAGSADRYQVLVHLDQDMLAPDGEMAAILDDGTRVSSETFRRIACDAGLVVTRTAANDGDPSGVLDVGRRRRSIPTAIRRALWLRDRGCRFPGCPHTRFLHGHHIRHWLHGGRTSLDNLVLLCPRHHHMVHEDGFTVHVGADGALVFGSPLQRPLPAVPSRAARADTDTDTEDAAHSLQLWAAERHLDITPTTNLPCWDGAVPDYDSAISALLSPAA